MSNISSLLKPYENPNPDVILSGRSPRRISRVQRKVSRSSFGSPPGPGATNGIGYPTSRAFRDVGVARQPHPKPAVILRKRRPSQREGLPAIGSLSIPTTTKSNSCHPEQSEGSAVLSIKNPGAPRLAPLRSGFWKPPKTIEINQPTCRSDPPCTVNTPPHRRRGPTGRRTRTIAPVDGTESASSQ